MKCLVLNQNLSITPEIRPSGVISSCSSLLAVTSAGTVFILPNLQLRSGIQPPPPGLIHGESETTNLGAY